MTRITGVLLLLLVSQIALAMLSPGLTHAAVKQLADAAPVVALLSGPALVGLLCARSLANDRALARSFWLIICAGLAMRLVWFGAEAPLEDDFHRYLWDGAVVAAGSNPYAFSPEQVRHGVSIPPALLELAATGRPTLDRISFPEYTSIYPAFAQLVFADAKSSDGSREIAAKHGAVVVREPRPGYGHACLTALAAMPPVDVIVFLDGDASDDPTEMAALLAPIANGSADFVVGSRTLGECEAGALTPQQLFGNWLACLLMRSIWGARFTDLGPFRAVRRVTLEQLALTDENYGWTVEMQVRAVKHGIRTIEIPVRYRCRIGMSKVSGTIKGVIGVGVKILYVIGREAVLRG